MKPFRIALVALVLWLPAAVAAADDYGPVAEFHLKGQDNQSVRLADLKGKVWVASFVMTLCPDGQCPAVTRTVAQLQEQMAGRRDLRFVTFTVNPEKDDPDVLARYARDFGADPERWLFLTGTPDDIAGVLRSFHHPVGKDSRDNPLHRSQLYLVDRDGRLRGTFPGFPGPPGDVEREEMFKYEFSRLKRTADRLLEPELPAYVPRDFPLFNAALNALSATLILLGYVAIRARLVRLHVASMLSALAVSTVFLASYVFYHIVVKEGRSTRFEDQAPGAPAWVKYLYYGVLFSHIVLAIFVPPLALYTAWQGLRGQLQRHVRVARWTLPVWLYVSVTGVVVYWMLYRMYPLP